jgi:hypothetical protein
MKASYLISCLQDLIDKHGDLDAILDCESIPTEIDSVSVLVDPYSKTSVFLIFSLQDIADIGSAEVEQRRLTI